MQIAEESSLELDARTGDDNEVKGAAFLCIVTML